MDQIITIIHTSVSILLCVLVIMLTFPVNHRITRNPVRITVNIIFVIVIIRVQLVTSLLLHFLLILTAAGMLFMIILLITSAFTGLISRSLGRTAKTMLLFKVSHAFDRITEGICNWLVHDRDDY
ncbi:MAG: hypothetical protein ACSW8A_07490 [Lachnospiraceae bacterium]